MTIDALHEISEELNHALEKYLNDPWIQEIASRLQAEIDKLKAEPVGWRHKTEHGTRYSDGPVMPELRLSWEPLYAAPQQDMQEALSEARAKIAELEGIKDSLNGHLSNAGDRIEELETFISKQTLEWTEQRKQIADLTAQLAERNGP